MGEKIEVLNPKQNKEGIYQITLISKTRRNCFKNTKVPADPTKPTPTSP